MEDEEKETLAEPRNEKVSWSCRFSVFRVFTHLQDF